MLTLAKIRGAKKPEAFEQQRPCLEKCVTNIKSSHRVLRREINLAIYTLAPSVVAQPHPVCPTVFLAFTMSKE